MAAHYRSTRVDTCPCTRDGVVGSAWGRVWFGVGWFCLVDDVAEVNPSSAWQ